MPLNRMSYNTADKIIDLYSGLLVNMNNECYGYSALKGYDIIDVSNAIKLMVAYKFYNINSDEKAKIEELKEYIGAGDVSISAVYVHFYPDEIAHNLNKIDPLDRMLAIYSQIDLATNGKNYEWNNLSQSQETIDSFFNFCQSIGNKYPNYWEMVYSRIGILWETNDDKDKINFIIKLKHYSSRNRENTLDINPTNKKYNNLTKNKGILQYLKSIFLKT